MQLSEAVGSFLRTRFRGADLEKQALRILAVTKRLFPLPRGA